MSTNQQLGRGEELILAVILLAYIVSFFLPVTDAGRPPALYGYQAFLLGIASIIFLPEGAANPAFWIGCGSFGDGRWKAARNAGALALLSAVSEVWMRGDPPEIGYFVWTASMGILTLASGVQILRHGRFRHANMRMVAL
jgi:hypothetical protein